MNAANFKSDCKTMTDDQLIERVEYLVRRERELVECLIWHLQEIQDRKLFIPMGFTSLFECLVKHFKYSEAIAYSRISALKIINAVPEAAKALGAGKVNVTTLSLTQSFIRKQEKASGEKISLDQKVEYLNSIKNKTVQETKQILARINPVKELPPDKIQYLDADHVQIQMTVTKDILEKIERLKSLISHENVDPSFNELMSVALDNAIDKIEKKKGIKTNSTAVSRHTECGLSQATESNKLDLKNIESGSERVNKNADNLITTQSFAIKRSRYISRKIKQDVLIRSRGRCEHLHPDGQRCGSSFQLQFDHVSPFSKGGKSEFDNIQILCRVHNSYKGGN